MKQEAIKRMGLLGLPLNVTQAFRENRKLHIWDDENMELSSLNELEQEIVAEFERRHQSVVYYAHEFWGTSFLSLRKPL